MCLSLINAVDETDTSKPGKKPKTSLLPCLKVKVTGLGQRSRSNLWRAAVDIRGLALLTAAKSNKSHNQSKVFVCNQ